MSEQVQNSHIQMKTYVKMILKRFELDPNLLLLIRFKKRECGVCSVWWPLLLLLVLGVSGTSCAQCRVQCVKWWDSVFFKLLTMHLLVKGLRLFCLCQRRMCCFLTRCEKRRNVRAGSLKSSQSVSFLSAQMRTHTGEESILCRRLMMLDMSCLSHNRKKLILFYVSIIMILAIWWYINGLFHTLGLIWTFQYAAFLQLLTRHVCFSWESIINQVCVTSHLSCSVNSTCQCSAALNLIGWGWAHTQHGSWTFWLFRMEFCLHNEALNGRFSLVLL